ncbi:hypothetical protein DAERI_040084 [Deinococcus aerius]|uniref:DUF402 domain-containing protein n=1 Tax=Deinococcus aerius TaxID=200253 RepID=A0A2I9CU37_9DEIO|nr:DUF402 domain-containing protein [Deinococcus aerius]GBF05324.1 hypothetical protein DAERI_040084 [Deinococcus aerius]
MKRKVFDLRPWPRVARHTQTVTHIPGYVIVDFTAHEVARPLDVPFGERTVRILDHGFRWVRAHPTGTGEGVIGDAITVQLNAAGQPEQLYVDIHAGEGVGEDGLPWTEDVYLDVIADWQPGWEVTETHIIDADELEEAVRAGLVSPTLAEAAWTHARLVEEGLRAGTYAPLGVLRGYLEDPYT